MVPFLVYGLLGALWLAPPDYQQGDVYSRAISDWFACALHQYERGGIYFSSLEN